MHMCILTYHMHNKNITYVHCCHMNLFLPKLGFFPFQFSTWLPWENHLINLVEKE